MARRDVAWPRQEGDASAVAAGGGDEPPSPRRRVLLGRLAALLFVLIAVFVQVWLPDLWVERFPAITQPMDFSHEEKTQIVNYLVNQCPGAHCESFTHHELRRMVSGLDDDVLNRMLFGSRPDIVHKLKPSYAITYVQHSLYRFFEVTVGPCLEQVTTLPDVAGRASAAIDTFDQAFRDLSQAKPSCAFLGDAFSRISSYEKQRSDIIPAYRAAFGRFTQELAFPLADEALHSAFDQLDALTSLVNSTLDEKDAGAARRLIVLISQSISVHLKLYQEVETTIYQEQREGQKTSLQRNGYLAIAFILFIFWPFIQKSWRGSEGEHVEVEAIINRITHFVQVVLGIR